jgi:hypothetical protein
MACAVTPTTLTVASPKKAPNDTIAPTDAVRRSRPSRARWSGRPVGAAADWISVDGGG